MEPQGKNSGGMLVSSPTMKFKALKTATIYLVELTANNEDAQQLTFNDNTR